jgi:hypothetical protein
VTRPGYAAISDSRLLLRDAVNCASFGGQADHWDRDDSAFGKAFRKHRLSPIIVGITEGWQQHWLQN